MVHYAASQERAEATVAELPGAGHQLYGADLTDADQARALVEATVEQLGGVDVLVNNAGIAVPLHPILDCSYEQWQAGWQQIVAVNLIGPANVTYCAVQHMRDQGGRIINVGSRAAFRGMPTVPAYAATKAALQAFGQSLAVALGDRGIAVTAVAPGIVDAGMALPVLDGPAGESLRAQSPLGRVGTAEEVAEAVLYLASPQAEFASGTVLDLNGASYLR